MSNLSELLPSGGGQNAVDFVASGTLSSGQTVALNSDGTVAAAGTITLLTTPNLGTNTTFGSGDVDQVVSVYDPSAQKTVIVYKKNNYPTIDVAAVVATVSGTTITFGSEVIAASNVTDAYSISAVYDSANNKIVISYIDRSNSYYPTAQVGTVSGTSISFGSKTVIASVSGDYYLDSTYDSVSGKIIVVGNQYGEPVGYVGTVSGTSISFGSSYNVATGTTQQVVCYDSANNKIVMAWRTGTNNKAAVGTISGTTISWGASTTYDSTSIEQVTIAYDTTSEKVVVSFKSSSQGKAVVGTVSGTSISFGSVVTVSSVSTGDIFVKANPVFGQLLFTLDSGATNVGNVLIATVSGTSLSLGTTTEFYSSSSGLPTSSCNTDTGQMLVVHSFYTGRAITVETGSNNYTDFIGITASAIADTATGSVNTFGGINEAQSGLTIGSDYYVQDDGTLSTTASSVKVGKAISATTINMMDLT